MVGIIGTGGHARVILDILQLCSDDHSLIFFSHETPQHSCFDQQRILMDHPTLLRHWIARGIKWHVAIGDPVLRRTKLQFLLLQQGSLTSVIHPKSTISNSAVIKDGTSIMAGAVINPSTRIGLGCVINTSSSIDHDSVIEDYVNVGPGTHLAGGVSVGERSELGTGSIVLPNVKIGKLCTVGAGSVVTKDLPDRSIAYGTPARIIKTKT